MGDGQIISGNTVELIGADLVLYEYTWMAVYSNEVEKILEWRV